MSRYPKVVCVLAIVIAGAAHGISPTVTLTDPAGPNSLVDISHLTTDGLFNWSILGLDHMNRNSYWYRIGSFGPATSLFSLGTPSLSQPTTDTVMVTFTGSQLTARLTYTLYGSPMNSGASDVAQSITFTNNSGSVMAVNLFEFADFDLNGTPGDDTAWRDPSGNIFQKDGVFAGTLAQVGANGSTRWEIGDATTLYNKINTTSFGDLANSTTPYTGNAAWAMQWNFSLARNGGSQSMSEDLLLDAPSVPEPGTISMLGAGVLGILSTRRRRR